MIDPLAELIAEHRESYALWMEEQEKALTEGRRPKRKLQKAAANG